jgi:hypothetical protein
LKMKNNLTQQLMMIQAVNSVRKEASR